MPWRGPSYPGELPSLGWYVIDWMEEHLLVPDGRLGGEPMRLTREQAEFLLRFYTLDPGTGTRRVTRGVLSRAKGWGKSPLLAAVCLAEAFADVVPDGWDEDGEPVGRPWTSLGFKALVQVVAVSEDQTANTWGPLLDMAKTSGALLAAYDYDPMETFIALPRGRIDYRTASATSAEGYRPIFSPCDQTESWTPSNGGVRLFDAVKRNLTKTGGSMIESPNSYRPSDRATMSVAQRTHDAYRLQAAGKVRGSEGRILWDHREAPASTVMSDEASLMAGLAYAYGCSAIPLDERGCALHGRECAPGWVDLRGIADDVWDPATDPGDARQYYLGQITGAEDAWVTAPEWEDRRRDETARLKPGDTVTLGFDGSRRRKKGVTDATALVAVRVADGHAELLRAWEEPVPCPADWEIPEAEVDAEVSDAFERYTVVGFYADPAKWESWVSTWEARYGRRLKVKATASKPITWWLNEGRKTLVRRAIASTQQAIRTGPLTHRAQATLSEHVLNARVEDGWIRKETPDSAKKIDASWALVLAWQARLDAVATRAVRQGYRPRPQSRR